jgi:5-methylcytosine-specific restriction protein A
MLGGHVNVASSPSWQDDRRASRHARGYGTEWDKLRPQILERDNHICQCRRCKGGELRLRPATQVDHVVSKEEWRLLHAGSMDGVDDPSNLQAINFECHRRKTDEDRARVAAGGGGGVFGRAE